MARPMLDLSDQTGYSADLSDLRRKIQRMGNAAITLYGIRTCDTCRKARRWLDSHGIGHRYHDLREDGLEATTLDRWIAVAGLERVINRRGTTWRQLAGEADGKARPDDLRGLILAHPTLVKRPVISIGEELLTIGFTAREQQQVLDALGEGPAGGATAAPSN